MAESVEQDLFAGNVEAVTVQHGDDPPTLMLRIEVTHAETGVSWKQSLTFTRQQWVDLMRLLNYACENEGVIWQ